MMSSDNSIYNENAVIRIFPV